MSTRALKRGLLAALLLFVLLGTALWARFGAEVFLTGMGPLFCG
jgi:hypothetical protein